MQNADPMVQQYAQRTGRWPRRRSSVRRSHLLAPWPHRRTLAGCTMAARAGGGKSRVSDPFRFDGALLASVFDGGQDAGSPAGGHRRSGAWVSRGAVGRGCRGAGLRRHVVPGLRGLTDSKLLTPEAREVMYQVILCVAARVSWVAFSPITIDQIGLHRCNLSALGRALESLQGEYRLALVDGFDLKRPEFRAFWSAPTTRAPRWPRPRWSRK